MSLKKINEILCEAMGIKEGTLEMPVNEFIIAQQPKIKYQYRIYRRKTDFDYFVHIEMAFDGVTLCQQWITLTHGKDRNHLADDLRRARNRMKKELIEKHRKLQRGFE